MVAYNFQPRFAELVSLGTKLHTIRPPRKSRHARVGEPIQLYTGMRTKQCQKLIDPDPLCTRVIEVLIFRGGLVVAGQRNVNLEQLDQFARCDGFESYADLADWFDETYGLPFKGTLIAWLNDLPWEATP